MSRSKDTCSNGTASHSGHGSGSGSGSASGSGSSSGHGIRRSTPRSLVNPCIKYFLFFTNFIFWLAGGVMAGLMIWVLVVNQPVLSRFTDLAFNPAIILLIVGLVVFSLTFFGCVGSLRENICFLKVFHVSLSVLLVLETLMGIFVFVCFYAREVRQQLPWLQVEQTLLQAIDHYREPSRADMADLIDTVQTNLHCCGVSSATEGFRDWQRNRYFNCSSANRSPWRCGVPSSCCRAPPGAQLRNAQCGRGMTDKSDSEASERIYTRGCLVGLTQWLQRNALIIGGICFGIILPQALAICLACALGDQIRLQRARQRRIGVTTHEVGYSTDYTDTYTLI